MFNDNRYIEKLYNFLIIIRLNKQILDEFKLFKVLVLKKEKLIWLYCGSTYSLINCQIKKKKPSYYVYFLRSASSVVLSHYFSSRTAITNSYAGQTYDNVAYGQLDLPPISDFSSIRERIGSSLERLLRDEYRAHEAKPLTRF